MRRDETMSRAKLTETRLDELAALLDESLSCFERDRQQQTFKTLSNFKQFEKNLNLLQKKSNSSSPLLHKNLLLHNWDLVVLALLSVLFAAYLAFFAASYFSSPTAVYLDLSAQLHAETRLVYKWLVAKWMQFNNFNDFTKEECALVMPDLLNSVLRPIDNCAMCRPLALDNNNTIRRVSNITKEEFLEKYAYTGVPVVITDAIKHWSALKVFNFQFLKELYLNGNQKQPFEEGRRDRSSSSSRLSCQFFPYRSKFKSLVEVLEMEASEVESAPWYVGWSNCNNQATRVLRKHYKRPYFLPDESEMSRLDWIFMGTPGYGADIHIDDVSNPSWQAQISGIKYWTFKPNAECLFRCPFALNALVYPGDIIVFDSNRWFHSTLIVGSQLSLTIGSEYD